MWLDVCDEAPVLLQSPHGCMGYEGCRWGEYWDNKVGFRTSDVCGLEVGTIGLGIWLHAAT